MNSLLLPVAVQEEPKVTVTAVEVAHGGIKGAVVYIFKIGEKKVVCFWDIDMPEALRLSDALPNSTALQERKTLFEDADCMILEENIHSVSTSHGKPTGHTTYEGALTYLDMLAPKARKEGKVFITHMSGHEDGAGNPGYGWSDSEWEKTISQKDSLHIARQGMIIQV